MSNEQLQPIRTAIDAAPVAPVAKIVDAESAKQTPPRPEADKKKRAAAVDEAYVDFEELPGHCPVVPLGIKDDVYYYLDAKKQLRDLKAKDHGRLQLVGLFGDYSGFLYDTWPSLDDKGNAVRWKPEKAAEALMGTAANNGIIDVTDLVRGPGAWLGANNELVMHCGDVVYQADKNAITEQVPGKIGRHIYPADAPKPRPGDLTDPGTAPAKQILAHLQTWNWRRKDADPYLLLGWIGASMLGGALKWRPMAWITGDAATGKSTLHDLLTGLHGPGGMISASDASAAGLWQKVKHSSLPVQLDELESEDDNRKNANIIKLARHAASGGSTLRGGADHKGASFTVRNCFLFSSILIPPMLPQDLSRMTILQLDELPPGQTAPNLKPQDLAKIGAAFRSRLMARWDVLQDRLEAYRAMLGQCGHGGRGADLFGTLLACCDVLTHDHKPSLDTMEEWKLIMKRSTLSETENSQTDAQKCMTRLLSSLCDVYRDGARRTIGSWIEQAADMHAAADPTDANKVLAAYGLRVRGKGDEMRLLVANDHEGLASIFAGTRWERGVWVQSMRRWPGHEVSKTSTNFGGSSARYTGIPVKGLFVGDDEDAAQADTEGGDA
jgi:hypothetical protein